MTETSSFFLNEYPASRSRFQAGLAAVQRRWPGACRVSRSLGPAAEDLSVDWIEAAPLGAPEQVVMFTTGEHGIEGYVGSAVLELFMQEFLPLLDPHTTGLLLVHAINPWGMRHYRRTNAHNVDLNRNFVWDAAELDPALNPDYARLNALLNPSGPGGSLLGQQTAFLAGLARSMAGLGLPRFQRAALLGQYAFPQGIYYGGQAIQEENRLVMQLFRGVLAHYPRLLVLDMHTGYGPRDQMSLVNAVREPRASADLQQAFGYPHIVKTDPGEFYAIQGDMIEGFYTRAQQDAPEKHLYATSFEFGTFGNSVPALLRSLCTMIFENRLHHHGTPAENQRASIQREFLEMFYPQDAAWQAKALDNARAALRGILTAEGYLK